MRQGRAFSIIETLVTLVIVALTVTAVIEILQQVNGQTRSINARMTQQASIQYCLDRLLEDILAGNGSGARITIEKDSYGRHETAHVAITVSDKRDNQKVLRQVDWVAGPRYEEDDLVLYRREKTGEQQEEAVYIPLCENLYSFEVESLDPNGVPIEEPNQLGLLWVKVRMYGVGERDPERLVPVSRTFCMRRYPW